MFDKGWGVLQSETKAAEWYLRAAEKGISAAQYAIARMYETGRGLEKSAELAFKYAEMAASQNFVPAELMAGVLLATGAGVDRNVASARKWLERAMNNGSRDAKVYLETALQEGWLGKKESHKSFTYTLELANENDSGAVYDLAWKFSKGIGCIQNEAKAFELYERAAELGSHEAAMMLSMVFSHGLLGQKTDSQKAAEYLRLSESLFDASATKE
jgi:TPR repeat protein